MRKGDDFFRVTFDRKWDDTKIFEKKITYYQNRHHLTRPAAIMEICNRYISDDGTDYASDAFNSMNYQTLNNVGKASDMQEIPEPTFKPDFSTADENNYQNEGNPAYENDSDMPEMDEDAASAIIKDMFGGI